LGNSAVINIHARKITDDLASLVKQLDGMVDSVEDKKGNETKHAFLVYLTDDPDAAAAELESLAEKHKIKNVPLTVFDGAAGPPAYNIAKEAEVTIVMWKDREVQANHAFAANGLDKAALKKVLAQAKEFGKQPADAEPEQQPQN
jgi:hypothetical protein